MGLTTDSTGLDEFVVTGQNNTALSGAGNLIVAGGTTQSMSAASVTDSRTTIVLNANDGGPVVDTSSLNGQKNDIYMTGVSAAKVTGGSTVKVTVSQVALPVTEADGGGNYVNLINTSGTTSVTLSGHGDTVILNGDAANDVSLTGAPLLPERCSTVVVGGIGDKSFGHGSAITISGSRNTVITGDENTTITGGVGSNSIAIGDGTNAVTLTGQNNTIVTGGGFNTTDTGTSGAIVKILGAGYSNAAPPPPTRPSRRAPATRSRSAAAATSSSPPTRTWL